MSLILRTGAMGAFVFGALLIMPFAAHAKCSAISGTADGTDKSIAVARSQQAVAEAVVQWKAKFGVRNVSQSPRYAKPAPYWRDSVAAHLYVKPDIRTSRYHTTCWRGVISPVVCTTGTKVCF